MLRSLTLYSRTCYIRNFQLPKFQLKVSHNRGCILCQVLLYLNSTHFNLQRLSGSVTKTSTTSTRVCNKFVGVQTCALSTGDVVVYGGTTDYKFHVYGSDGKPKGTAFNRLCDHWITILSLLIENVEYLCVACEECRNIRLINLKKEERPFIAYTGNASKCDCKIITIVLCQ